MIKNEAISASAKLQGKPVQLTPALGIQYDAHDANTLYQLGLHARLAGNLEDALEFLEKATRAAPGNCAIRNSLGDAYISCGQFEQAAAHLLKGLACDPGHKELLANMGVVSKASGELDKAGEYFRKSLASDPDFMFASESLDFLYKGIVPYWHFSMMNDEIRNAAYDRAIRAAVNPESVVLDIGTGAGLLAMMAARAGAKHVYTVEMVPSIAKAAREIATANGFADQITVICKDAKQLEVGVDLPEAADVLITETFDAGFLGEEALPLILYARTYLLKPNARIIPQSGIVFGSLLESPGLWQECAVGFASGFDLRLFNRFRESKSGKYVRDFQKRRLAPDFELFDFDFAGPAPVPERKELSITCTESGKLHMIAYWFKLFLDQENHIDTEPDQKTCWRVALQLVEPVRRVDRGEHLKLVAQHNCNWIKLRLVD